jgi:hypothetical protein
MALYMYEVAYTPESLAAQIREPHDRLEAVRPGLEAMGVKILLGGYPLGEYDVLIIVQADTLQVPGSLVPRSWQLRVICRYNSTQSGRSGCSYCGQQRIDIQVVVGRGSPDARVHRIYRPAASSGPASKSVADHLVSRLASTCRLSWSRLGWVIRLHPWCPHRGRPGTSG